MILQYKQFCFVCVEATQYKEGGFEDARPEDVGCGPPILVID